MADELAGGGVDAVGALPLVAVGLIAERLCDVRCRRWPSLDIPPTLPVDGRTPFLG